jgi:hypothetical protein
MLGQLGLFQGVISRFEPKVPSQAAAIRPQGLTPEDIEELENDQQLSSGVTQGLLHLGRRNALFHHERQIEFGRGKAARSDDRLGSAGGSQ